MLTETEQKFWQSLGSIIADDHEVVLGETVGYFKTK